jgi:hypothetical protein
VSKTWKKKFRKSIGIFIINATEILPYVKISHENYILFGKITMQMSHFWKIYRANDPILEMKIRSFWSIFHANKIFLEKLPFNGYISMEIDTKGKLPLYGYA